MILWRTVQLFMARYGSIPTGQTLVSLSTVMLNELGGAPTVTELCEGSGLPKSSISRYVSEAMSNGLITEDIDPEDRRRRRLVQTGVGREERRYFIRQLRKILDEVRDWDLARAGESVAPADQIRQMQAAVRASPEPFRQRPRRGPRRAAD